MHWLIDSLTNCIIDWWPAEHGCLMDTAVNMDANSLWVWSDLGGHAVAGVEDGFVVLLRALVQAVAASFAVPHLKGNRGGTGT